MDDQFKILLQAAVDLQKSQNEVNKQIKQIQENAKKLEIPIEIDRKTALKTIKDMSVEAQKALDSNKKILDNRISSYLKDNTKLSADYRNKLIGIKDAIVDVDKVGFGTLKKEFREVTSSAESLGQTGASTFDKLGKNVKQFVSYLGAATIVMQGIRTLSGMVEEVKKLDSAMTSLKKVTDETDATYSKFLNGAADTAQKLGSSISDIVEMTATWAKLGYTIQEASELAKVSTIFANVADITNVDTAVKDLVTAMKAYNISANDSITIADKFNILGNKYATDAASLGEGLANSASALALAGNDINESLALLTGGTEITQNASEMGNAIKVLSMRLRGMRGELEDIGEEYDNILPVSKIQTQIFNLSKGTVNIMDDLDPTKFKSTYEIIEGISKVWSKISETDQAQLLEIVAGKQRGNQIAALIQAFQSGQAQNALKDSINSTNSALDEQAKYMESIQYSADKVGASFQQLSSNTLNSQWVKSFYEISNVLIQITDKVGLFNVALIATAGILNAKTGTVAIGWITKLTESIVGATGASTTLGLALSTMIPVALIVGGITVITKAYDYFNVTLEEQKQKLEESKTAYEDSITDLSNINNKLSETKNRIAELNKLDKLTFLEEDELDKLKSTTQELLIQKDILEKTQINNAKKLAKDAVDSFNKNFGGDEISNNQISEYRNNANSSGNNAILMSDSNDISAMLAAYKQFNELKKKAFNSGDNEEVSRYTDLLGGISTALYKNIESLSSYKSALKSIPDDQLSKDQKESLNEINSAIDLIYTKLDPTKWKEIQFEELISDDDVKKVIYDFETLSKTNPVSANQIESSSILKKALSETNLSAEELATQINTMAGKIDDSTPVIQKEVESMYSLADAAKEATGYVNDFGSDVDISKTTDAIGNAQTAVEDFKNILKEMDKNSGLTSEGLQKITQKYPQLLLYLGDEKELRKQLEYGIKDQQKTAENYYKQVLELDTNLYNTVVSNNSDKVNELNEYYKVDLSNYKSLAQAKNEVETTLLSSLKQKWADYYKAQAKVSSLESAKTSSDKIFEDFGIKDLTGQWGDINKNLFDSAKKEREDALAAAEKESQMYKEISDLFVNTDYTGLTLDNINLSSGKTKASDKKTNESAFSNQVDFAAERIKVLQTQLDKLNAKLENTKSIKGQIDAYSKLVEKQSELTNAYKETADVYQNQYSSALSKLSKSDRNKVTTGAYTVDQFSGTGKDSIDEKRYNAIQKAIDLRDKLASAEKESISSFSKMVDYAKKLADIPWDQAENKVENLNSEIDLLNAKLENADSYKVKNELLDQILDKQKQIVSSYKTAIADTNKQINDIFGNIDKKNRVNSNGTTVKVGTKIATGGVSDPQQLAYIVEYNKYIDELTENTKKLTLEQEKYKKEVEDTAVQKFENINSEIDKIISGYEKIINQIDVAAGLMDENSLEQIALYQSGLNEAAEKSKKLSSEISKLNKQYSAQMISEEMYTERLSELSDQLADTATAMKSYKDKIISAMKARYDDQSDLLKKNLDKELDALEEVHDKTIDSLKDQLDAYKKIIDAKKESLRATEDEYQYQKKLAEHTKNISKITDRMAELQKAANSGDREAAAEIRKLQDELAEAQSDLDDTQHDRKVELEEDALDKAYNEYQDMINKQIDLADSAYENDKANSQKIYDDKMEKITTLYENEKQLIAEAAALTSSQFSEVFAKINSQLAEYGLSMSSGLSGAINTTNTGLSGVGSGIGVGASKGSGSFDSIKNLLQNGSSSSGDSELNKYIHSKYGSYLTFAEMAQLANMLGVSGINGASDVQGNSTNRTKILNALKSAKYGDGGMLDAGDINSSIKGMGEDFLFVGKRKESVLKEDETKAYQKVAGFMPDIVSLISSGLLNSSNYTTNTNNSPSFEITIPISGNADTSTVNGLKSATKDIVNQVSEVIMKKMRIS